MKPAKHGRDHRPGSEDEIYYAVWHIALTGDRVGTDDVVAVEDGVFRPPIVKDMDGLYLKALALGLGVASSSGSVSVMIRNDTKNVNMLGSVASIASGARYADQTSVISSTVANTLVDEGDIIQFNITAAGTGSMGLKAILVFRL